jgi:hypothetical protein
MALRKLHKAWLAAVLLCLAATIVKAQSFRVQCPSSTITHPTADKNKSEPTYSGPTTLACALANPDGSCNTYLTPTANVNGAIKCQQISGGDGFATMGDGTQTYMFSFGPLSGLSDIAKGLPGTQFPNVFNSLYSGPMLQPGDPATAVDSGIPFAFNGAVGQVPEIAAMVTITNIVEGPLPATFPPTTACAGNPATLPANTVSVYTNAPLGLAVGAQVVIANSNGSTTPAGYLGPHTITCVDNTNVLAPDGFNGFVFTYTAATTGLAANIGTDNAGTASAASVVDGHVDPRQIMDVGVMNGNIPAPLIAMDEDDELFLTLTNVGMVMRPDLFEQHTVHFHGYPNASSFYDGVPDASVAINIGGSFTYYYLAPDAGTYFWHCHITPPEHLQMGMVGQLYVRPRQNRVQSGTSLFTALRQQQQDPRTACRRPGDGSSPTITSVPDILCSNPVPAVNTGSTGGGKYAYNDGDGSTAYDYEYPLQMHGFDPNFHFVGMTFNPEAFSDMKDKYFLLNGRSYPDTVKAGPMETQTSDGANHYAQPLPSIINIQVGKKALLRISNLDVSEYQTLASLGIPMKVIALNAKLLRDQQGNNLYYKTNSITLGGGESLDVILDATEYKPGQVFYLYTPNLDHLSNDAENFGGLMTEVHVCSSVTGGTTFGNTCN